jgi:hypothetical protein
MKRVEVHGSSCNGLYRFHKASFLGWGGQEGITGQIDVIALLAMETLMSSLKKTFQTAILLEAALFVMVVRRLRCHSPSRFSPLSGRKVYRSRLIAAKYGMQIVLMLLASVGSVRSQTLVAFETPQQGYAATNGTFTATVDLKIGAEPSTLHVTSGITDVTSLFNVNGCTQAPCTISATLTNASGIVAGQNFLIASVLGIGGAAQTAHMQFGGSGLSDPSNGSAPGYIVSVQQTTNASSSSITIGTPTPTVVSQCGGGGFINITVLNRSTLALKSTSCYSPAAVAPFLSGLDQSDIIFVVSTPGQNTGTADFTGMGGSKSPAGGFTQYAAVGYGKASAGMAHEAWYDANQIGSAYATVRGTLANLGCQTLYGTDSKGNTVPPTTLPACATNQNASLYSFLEADNLGFAIVPGAAGSAGDPGLPTIYVGNSSNIPVGDSTIPTNQIRPLNSNTSSDFFTYATYTPTWTGGNAVGGVYLVVLNSIDMSLISKTLYITNCGESCTDLTGENDQISALAAVLTTTTSNPTTNTGAQQHPNQIYLFTTVGIPFNSGSITAPLLSAVSALGISPYALQAVVPDNMGTPPGTGFSFVSYALEPVALNPISSGVLVLDVNRSSINPVKLWSSSANTQLGETGALRGVFVKGIDSYYAPTDVSAFDASNLPVYATGDDYLSHAASYALGSTEPVSWPFMDTAGGRAAYSYLSFQLINYNLFTGGNPNSTNQCSFECQDIRFWYTGDQAAGLYTPLASAQVNYPGDSTAAANGFTKADFDNVQQQLDLEQVYLKEVLALKSYAEQINTATSQNVALALTQAGTNIALDLQDQLGFSQQEVGDTPIRIAGDSFNLLAGAVSAAIPLFTPKEGSEIGKVVKDIGLPVGDGVFWALSAVLTIVADADTNTTNTQPDPYVLQLQQLISTESNAATASATNFNANLESATGTFYNGVFSDWFRLQSAALMSVNQGYGGWYVADTDQGAALGAQISALTAAQRVQLWQQVVPHYFTKAQYNGVASGWLAHNYPGQIDDLGHAAYYFSSWYPLFEIGPSSPNCGQGCNGITVDPTAGVQAGWTARTSASQPSVCQDMTFIFEGTKFGRFWTSTIGATLMGVPSGSNGLGNLGIDSNWLFDEWGIPWFAKSTDGSPMGFPQTVKSDKLLDQDLNTSLSWACGSHSWPFTGQPVVSFSDFSITPAATITQGLTPNVTVAGKISASGTTKIPSGSVSITIDDITQTAKINSSDGSFSSLFATQSIPGSPTPYVIAISYPGASNYAPGSDVSQTLTVLSPDTDVQLRVDLNPSYYGQTLNLTAMVKSPAGTPSGLVTFYDNALSLGAKSLDSTGQAQLPVTQLGAGTHLMTATYAGANGISGNTSDLIYVEVNLLTTTLVVPSPTIPVTFGNATAHLTGQIVGKNGATIVSYPPAGETVTVTINKAIQSTKLLANGNFVMDFPITSLPVGSYPVQIQYGGDNNFTALTDQTTSLAIGEATTTFGALTPSLTIQAGTPSIALSGKLVTLNGVIPTGTVKVQINGADSAPVALSDGSFTLSYGSVTLLASATPYTIYYTYSGDSNYVETEDVTTTLTVLQTAISTAFRNLTLSQAIDYGRPSVALSGTISTTPQSGGVLTQGVNIGATFVYNNPYDAADQVDTTHSTFSAWIDTTAKSEQMILYDDARTSTGGLTTMFLYMQGDQIGVRWADGPNPSDDWLSKNTTPISDGQWHHIAIVFGTDAVNGLWNARLYKDGVSTGETFGQNQYNFIGSIELAGHSNDGSIPGFVGAIWDAKIWNKALSVFDLAADLYQFYQAPTPSGLLLESSFDPVAQTGINVANARFTCCSALSIANEQLPVLAPPTGEKVSINVGADTQQATIGLLGAFSLDFATAGIVPGNYPVQYRYSGDSTFSATSDGSTTLVVQPTVTTTNLASSATSSSPVVYGTQLNFTATVSAPNVVPTGTVTFYDGYTAIGPGELLNTGKAFFSTSSLAVGSHSIMAAYPGAVEYSTSTSTIIPITIKALTPAFSNLTSSTISYGTSTATLGGIIFAGDAIPSGSVTISVTGPSTVQASATIKLDGTFSTSLNTSKLALGTYQVTYSYLASGNFGDAINNSTQLIVGLASSSTSLTSSSSSVAFETAIAFNATVTSITGTPSGTVTFIDGTTPLVPSVTLSFGAASLPTAALTPGLHSITAIYSGETTVAASKSSAVTVTVVPLTTVLYSSSSPAPVPYGGATVYLSGQIAGSSGGTVVDYPTGQALTITVGKISQTVTLQKYGTFGTYFPVMNFAADTYPIKLDYAGSTQFSSMSDASLQLTISKSTPVFSNLIAKPAVNVSTSSIVLSGVLSAQPQTGTVLQFTQSNNSGVGGVVLPYDQSAVSTDSATYSVWIKTSTKTQQMLIQVAYEHPYIYMQNDQLGVLWDGAGDGWLSTDTTPISDGLWHNIVITFNQGKITFYKDGIATNDSFSVSNSYHSDTPLNLGGSYAHIPSFMGEMWNAKLWSKALSAADIQDDIFAVYGGNVPVGLQLLTSLDVSNKTITNIVNGATAVTPVNPPTDPQIVADALPSPAPMAAEPLLVTVNGQDSPFWIGASGSFAGTFDANTLTTGTYPITYTFGGDSNFVPATDKTTSVTVQFGATITSLTSSTNPAQYASNVTFMATVSPKNGAGTPTGNIIFKDGSAQISSAAAIIGGFAQLTVNSLAAGPHSITAIYSGDTTFATSTSNVLPQNIAALKPVFITLTPSQTIPVGTASVTFGGQISAGTYIPSGTVSIALNGLTMAATIQTDGTFSAIVDTHALTFDSYAVTYSFAASGNFKSASDSNTRITVAAANTTIALTSPSAIVNYGQFLTFTAMVTNPSTATGSVTFYDGGNILGTPVSVTAGKAVWQTGSLSVGSHSMTAMYTSDSPYYTGSTSPALTETILALATVFDNLTPSQTAGANASNLKLSGTISSTPRNDSMLKFADQSQGSSGGVLMSYADSSNVSTDHATYSAWIKTTSTDRQIIIHANRDRPYLFIDNNQIGITWDGAGVDQWLSPDKTAISDGKWHHIAITFDNGLISFYKDGIGMVDTFTVPNSTPAGNPFNLGGDDAGITSFSGEMWNVKIWSVAAASDDVRSDMMQTYSDPYPHGLEFQSSFDAGANTGKNAVTGSSAIFVNAGTLAQTTVDVLPAYFPAINEPVSITIGSQVQTVDIGQFGSFTSTFPLGTLAAGSYPIQYSYKGNSYLAPGTDESTTLTVANSSTTIAVSSSALTTDYGLTVIFSAIVTSQNGTPTGTATFEDGGVPMGAPVALAAGRAQFPASTLLVGLHSITVVYSSDNTSTFAGSTSAAITQTVSKLSPVFSNLTKSLSIAPGGALMLGGTIKAGDAIPAGSVAITFNSTTTLPTISSSGTFSQSFDTSQLIAGAYKVTYTFSSSDTFNGLTDGITTTVTVTGLVTPAVVLQASTNPVQQGDTVTLTATVHQIGIIVPTGNVTFSETVGTDGKPLPGGIITYGNADLVDGTATLAVTATSNPTFAAGMHVLVATYGGDGGNAYKGNGSAFYTLTVNPSLGSSASGLSLTVATGSSTIATVSKGAAASFPLSLASASGFTGTVAITCTPVNVVSTMDCSATPALMTLSSVPQSLTIKITTADTIANSAQNMAFLIGGLGLIPFAFRRRRALTSLVLLISVAGLACTGCAGGGSSQKLQYASPGTYKFTITASSTSGAPATSSVGLTVIVQ